MVKLRLRRKGRAHYPVYDIVAVDGRARRDGAFIERLGFVNPNTQPSTVTINPNRTLYWLNVGAQPTDVVRDLLSYEGILLRRHLNFKGISQAEIEEAVSKHKEVVKSRYFRRKELRKQRRAAKAAAEKASKEG
jgi:small subunit ribosomal protein S16